jgi:hypothetical protein
MKRSAGYGAGYGVTVTLAMCVCKALMRVVVLVTSRLPAQAGISVWTSIGPGNASIQALAINPTTPTTLYAGGYDDGVFSV